MKIVKNDASFLSFQCMLMCYIGSNTYYKPSISEGEFADACGFPLSLKYCGNVGLFTLPKLNAPARTNKIQNTAAYSWRITASQSEGSKYFISLKNKLL